MAKMLGYMLTWTTYGTWLQGNERGYVKDGAILPANESLESANRQSQSQDAVYLSAAQRKAVREAIVKEAALRGHHIFALAVSATHVHLVAQCVAEPIGRVVAWYKTAGRAVLNDLGHDGRIWTRGYDKRFCFDRATLGARIRYVESHNDV